MSGRIIQRRARLHSAADQQRNALAALSTALAPLAALPLAAILAWQLLSAVDFSYPLLYDALAIDEHIARYAPQNRYRDGFATTTEPERLALFAAMVGAINHGGDGLRQLAYTPTNRESAVPLLREPEIEHLTRVAGLIDALRIAGGAGAAALLAITVVLRRSRRRLAGWPLIAGGSTVLALAGLFAFAGFDPGGWFDRLHDWAFPPGHQWFFYYQESLMTTLLKAPDLFGPIGAALTLLTLALLTGALWLVRQFT